MMAAGVLCNLGILFYFKYFDFFIENVSCIWYFVFAKGNPASAGNQFFYLPADWFSCGHLPGGNQGVQFFGLCAVCLLFPAADCGADCESQ